MPRLIFIHFQQRIYSKPYDLLRYKQFLSMTDEEDDRLNFYSKYNRVKDRQDIDTLYSLIDNNKPAEIHLVNVSLMRQERERRAQQELKHKNSKLIIPRQILEKQNDENHDEEYDQINVKLQKLKILQRQFHEDMDRRERNLKKKRQLKEQKRKQQENYKGQLINVVEFKPSDTSSLKSSQLKSKKNGSLMHEVVVDNQELDFEDYYREVPKVSIYSSYIANSENKRQFRHKIEENQNREAYVESVNEEGDKSVGSIVIDRMDYRSKNIGKIEKYEIKVKDFVQVELMHSQSYNVIDQKRLEKKQFQLEEKEISQRKASHELKQPVCQDYSPARHLDSIQENLYLNCVDQPKYQAVQPQQDVEMNYESQQGKNDQQIEPENHQNKQKQVFKGINQDQMREDYTSKQINLPYGNNYTGTQEGEQIRQEIQDRVGPIINKSDYKQQNYNNVSVQPSVFHSQAVPNSKIYSVKQVRSLASDSLDYHPLEPPNELPIIPKSLENKKSSFKKLMAQNRANLVPRMAISTILNEHINEALIDFKHIANPAVSPLHHSIINTQSPTPLSPPSRKKRVNFKQKIVEQQLNKSYSRDGRPVFERDQSRVDKNRGLLLTFFAQN